MIINPFTLTGCSSYTLTAHCFAASGADVNGDPDPGNRSLLCDHDTVPIDSSTGDLTLKSDGFPGGHPPPGHWFGHFSLYVEGVDGGEYECDSLPLHIVAEDPCVTYKNEMSLRNPPSPSLSGFTYTLGDPTNS